MSQKKLASDEFDLLEFISILSKNKFKLILITLIFPLATFIYQSNKAPHKFKYLATTEIRPISIVDESKYYNQVDGLYVKIK